MKHLSLQTHFPLWNFTLFAYQLVQEEENSTAWEPTKFTLKVQKKKSVTKPEKCEIWWDLEESYLGPEMTSWSAGIWLCWEIPQSWGRHRGGNLAYVGPGQRSVHPVQSLRHPEGHATDSSGLHSPNGGSSPDHLRWRGKQTNPAKMEGGN